MVYALYLAYFLVLAQHLLSNPGKGGGGRGAGVKLRFEGTAAANYVSVHQFVNYCCCSNTANTIRFHAVQL